VEKRLEHPRKVEEQLALAALKASSPSEIDVGRTVMTTVQKFQELTGGSDAKKRAVRDEHPVLSTACSIVYVSV
jgi:hypothetical protein